jgi:hypothetical protein
VYVWHKEIFKKCSIYSHKKLKTADTLPELTEHELLLLAHEMDVPLMTLRMKEILLLSTLQLNK